MTGTTTTIYPDQLQLTRIFVAFPGRQFRYLWATRLDETGLPECCYGIIEGNPEDPGEAETLGYLIREIGDIAVVLVLGGADWQPPA